MNQEQQTQAQHIPATAQAEKKRAAHKLNPVLDAAFKQLEKELTTMPLQLATPEVFSLPLITSPQGLIGKTIARDDKATAVRQEIRRMQSKADKLLTLYAALEVAEWELRRYRILERNRIANKKADHNDKQAARQAKINADAVKEAEKAVKKQKRKLAAMGVDDVVDELEEMDLC